MQEGKDFEKQLEKNIFSQSVEKSFIDKLFAKEDVDRLRRLIKKDKWVKTDVSEVLYLLSGNEQKLLNHSEYSRYFSLKFFVWVRDFAKTLEEFYDYVLTLEAKEKAIKEQKKKDNNMKVEFELTPVAKLMVNNIVKELEHDLKFLIDLLVRIDRTSMSIGATAFLESLKNRYEFVYDQKSVVSQSMPQESKKLFGLGKRAI